MKCILLFTTVYFVNVVKCKFFIFLFLFRYRIKLRVDDGTGDSVFVLFDNDAQYLLEKQCSVLISNAKVCGNYFIWQVNLFCIIGMICVGA